MAGGAALREPAQALSRHEPGLLSDEDGASEQGAERDALIRFRVVPRRASSTTEKPKTEKGGGHPHQVLKEACKIIVRVQIL